MVLFGWARGGEVVIWHTPITQTIMSHNSHKKYKKSVVERLGISPETTTQRMLQDYQSVDNASKNIHIVKNQSQGRVTQDVESVEIGHTSTSKAWCLRIWVRHAHRQLRDSPNPGSSGNTGWRKRQIRCLYATSHTNYLIHCEGETNAWLIVLVWSKDGKLTSVGQARTLSGICRLTRRGVRIWQAVFTTQVHPDMLQKNIVWTIYILDLHQEYPVHSG